MVFYYIQEDFLKVTLDNSIPNRFPTNNCSHYFTYDPIKEGAHMTGPSDCFNMFLI